MRDIDISQLGMLFRFYEALGFDRLAVDIPETASNGGDCLHKEEALKRLRAETGDCRRCRLSEGRTNLVFGEGNPDAGLMFVGEAPGEQEDRQGRPFVGKAGELLTRLIEKMGFSRDEVYIANTVKCRPPDNRNPMEDEIKTCMPFLEKQIGIIEPAVIMTLGSVATKALLGDIGSISRVRGKTCRYRGVPVVPTFHPSYLLRNPKSKWLTWNDAQVVLKLLES
ncbi:Uracil-DNA glycosylase, family 4 [hydrothermal vent metagenome]|uniref:Type-4 uracil-DNA glycosylase n=1 Tax=hydrothermal vent metagenome TaxID=652676 RepID=A0A3B1CD00_9ZZZZ